MPPLNSFNRTCLAVAASQLIVLPTQAATISVDSPLDDNGVECTLRQAVVSINSASLQGACINNGGDFGTADTINFDSNVFTAGGNHTITLTAASGRELQVAEDVVINGVGETDLAIDGGGKHRVFSIRESTVSLNDLTITGGSTTFNGGGILAVSANVSLNNSTVSGNSASTRGGGIFAESSSSVSLNKSTVSGNSANSAGGGIHVRDSSNANLSNSTVSNNSALFWGGIAAESSSSANLSNSTVSGNSANSTGGGITANDFSYIRLGNSTVSGNTGGYGGGIAVIHSGSVTLSNSIVSGNFGTEIEINNEYGVNIVTTKNANLFGDSRRSNAQAFNGFSPGAGDINATTDGRNIALSAILNPLADNGGSSETHSLPATSPAIGVATNACPDQDQRGQPRDSSFLLPIIAANRKITVVDLGGSCDIGAVEYQGGD